MLDHPTPPHPPTTRAPSPSPQPPPRRRAAAASVDEQHSSLLVHDGERLLPPTTTNSKKQQAEIWERVSMKAQAGAWVLGAAALVHYTDLVHVLLNDDRIHRYAIERSRCQFSFGRKKTHSLKTPFPPPQGLFPRGPGLHRHQPLHRRVPDRVLALCQTHRPGMGPLLPAHDPCRHPDRRVSADNDDVCAAADVADNMTMIRF